MIYDFFKLENNYNKSYEKIISQKKSRTLNPW